MYHKLIAMVTIAVVMTTISQASARKLNSAELKTLFSDTTVNWTNQKGNKITLWLNSDGSAKVLVVTPQRKVRREGKWWIKEPNIHCVKWVKKKKNTCRKIGNVEESGEGWTTHRRGITWTITKMKEKVVVSQNPEPVNLEKSLKEEVEAFRSKLPVKKGPASIQTMLSSGKAVFMVIRIDKKADEVDPSEFIPATKFGMSTKMCKEEKIVERLKAGASFLYTFIGSDGYRIGDTEIARSDCGL